jgi:hypothetical protein
VDVVSSVPGFALDVSDLAPVGTLLDPLLDATGGPQ